MSVQDIPPWQLTSFGLTYRWWFYPISSGVTQELSNCYPHQIAKRLYILSKHRFEVPIGPLFREMVETYLQLYYMAEIWEKVKELMIVSSPLVLPEMEPEKFLQLID
jgi:hypothetical protein